MKKILFLDIDGVLNCEDSFSALDVEKLDLLRMIVEASKCKIVLSSSWRLNDDACEELEDTFIQNKVPIWIDKTPYCNQERRVEIFQWIKDNIKPNENAQIAILDDDPDANLAHLEELIPNIKASFIKTSFKYGLTTKELNEILSAFVNI